MSASTSSPPSAPALLQVIYTFLVCKPHAPLNSGPTSVTCSPLCLWCVRHFPLGVPELVCDKHYSQVLWCMLERFLLALYNAAVPKHPWLPACSNRQVSLGTAQVRGPPDAQLMKMSMVKRHSSRNLLCHSNSHTSTCGCSILQLDAHALC